MGGLFRPLIVAFALLCCSCYVLGEHMSQTELPLALLQADIHNTIDEPNHDVLSALHSLVAQQQTERENELNVDIGADIAAIEMNANAMAEQAMQAEQAETQTPMPTSFIEKPKKAAAAQPKPHVGASLSNSKEDFIAAPLDYSPAHDKLYRASKQQFARSLKNKGTGAGVLNTNDAADADLSRLQLLANQLKMKRLTVERQRLEISNDEVKVAHLRDLLQANKAIYRKNVRSLRRSARAYEKAVKTYTYKIAPPKKRKSKKSKKGKKGKKGAKKAKKAPAAPKAAAPASKAAPAGDAPFVAKANPRAIALQHGAGGVQPVSARKPRKASTKKGKTAGGKAGAKPKKAGKGKKAPKVAKAAPGATPKAAKAGKGKKGGKKGKKGAVNGKAARFQQLMHEADRAEQDTESLLLEEEAREHATQAKLAASTPVLLEDNMSMDDESTAVPFHLQAQLDENAQQVAALISTTPDELMNLGVGADNEYTVHPTGNIRV